MARRVSCRGREVALTRREFDIFAALAAHPGWVCSAEALAGDDPRVYTSPASVNVHVSRLRRKFAQAGCTDCIETVRGAGYRFNVSADAGPTTAHDETGRADPFIGRTHEMRELESALSAAAGGDSRFVLVTGEPGLGKTRTAEELARRAPGPVLAAWGRCEPGGSPPYWLWVQVLRTIVDRMTPETHGSEELGRRTDALLQLLPDLGGSGSNPVALAELPPDQSTFALYDSVTRFLIDVSRRRQLLVVLDDLQ
jgi:DNA-binding winged helix-turn-helix (wHTH) protein